MVWLDSLCDIYIYPKGSPAMGVGLRLEKRTGN